LTGRTMLRASFDDFMWHRIWCNWWLQSLVQRSLFDVSKFFWDTSLTSPEFVFVCKVWREISFPFASLNVSSLSN
jgi:hypothetical protein